MAPSSGGLAPLVLSYDFNLKNNGANPPDEGVMMLVEGDNPVEFDLNVAAEDEVTYGNPCRDMVLVVYNHQKVQNKKRKRKPKAFVGLIQCSVMIESLSGGLRGNAGTFECWTQSWDGYQLPSTKLVNVNEKNIDLLYSAHDASDAFEANLNKMTEGMVKEAEFMAGLKDLEGVWSSKKKRRKFVKATIFRDALPENWRILLALCPRTKKTISHELASCHAAQISTNLAVYLYKKHCVLLLRFDLAFFLLKTFIKMQSKESKVVLSKALDASLVVTDCSGTKLDEHITSSSSRTYITHAVDADIRPVNDQVPFAEDAPEFCEFFEINDLKAQLQAKTTLICNLKNQIKSVKEASNEAKVKNDIDVIETINIELEHSVAKLLAANEQLHKEKDF
ncbi:retrovirus-related pol polyprotein from transposon TNT 1-94 [Tanacetum coccineum]